MSRPNNFVILGGGISGLSAAWYLSRHVPSTTKITILEGSNRFGGWIKSKRVGEHKILFEQGPRTLRPNGIGGPVINKLNLTSSLHAVTKNDDASKNRYIYYPDRLVKLPGSSLLSSLKSVMLNKFLLKTASSILLEPFVKSSKNYEDESIHEFISRRFDKSVSDILISALIHGIYAGDVKKLSVKSIFTRLYDLEQRHGSVIKGLLMGNKEAFLCQQDKDLLKIVNDENKELLAIMKDVSLYSFKDGIEQLPSAIVNDLKNRENVQLKTDNRVIKLEFGKKIKISTNDGVYEADHIISTIPSRELSHILPDKGTIPHLDYNPSVSVATINIAYNHPKILPVKGFGYLIPQSTPNNPYHILGVVFDSDAMPLQDEPPRTYTKLTVMIGGHYFNSISGKVDFPNKDILLQQSMEILEKHLGIYSTPLYYLVDIHKNCIPQYYVGHYSRLEELHYAIKKYYPNQLSVTGASYWGVSINDCVLNSAKLVLNLLSNSSNVVTGLERIDTKFRL
ncbi:954_t:CDS:2 [Funneliformis mosseae]|uniref:Protoporphyrinogen oxidase n=1 Tax=Funneliformis mosseae TaxID=27381 RepID=A0A9N9A6N9_FUNMO|nr:954_t:CDS:2 [Funneliformis mosseae]